jgi:HEAT repeat protein
VPSLWSHVPFTVDRVDPELLEADTATLLELLDGDDRGLRAAAACALALRDDPRAIDALVDCLQVKALRYPCLEALRHLDDRRAVPAVRAIFEKRFLSVFDRTQAAGLLAQQGDEAGRRHLLARLTRRRRDDDRGLAIELAADLKLDDAVPELERIAADRADLFRGAALKALAALRPEATRPHLVALVRDAEEDPDVRADCAEALHALGGAGVREALEVAAAADDAELAEVARGLLDA